MKSQHYQIKLHDFTYFKIHINKQKIGVIVVLGFSKDQNIQRNHERDPKYTNIQ